MCQREYLRERDYWGGQVRPPEVHSDEIRPDPHERDETWYRLWVCAGCEHATLEVCYTNTGMVEENGMYNTNTTYFPKRTEYNVAGKRFDQLPEKLDKMYRESIMAFNDGLNVLCAAGLRAVVEGICEDKGVQGKTLEKRIDALVSILPENIVASLHSFRFIGNTALCTDPLRLDTFGAILSSH